MAAMSSCHRIHARFYSKTDWSYQGYEADHHSIALLRLRNFTVGTRLSEEQVLGQDLVQTITLLIRSMYPWVSTASLLHYHLPSEFEALLAIPTHTFCQRPPICIPTSHLTGCEPEPAGGSKRHNPLFHQSAQCTLLA